MENRIKKNLLAISLLLLAATFAAGFGIAAALLSTTTQVFSANASIPTGDATETNESIVPTNNNKNNTIILAEKPFLVEYGKTLAATPINQTHIQISLAGNGTITLPNSTE